MSVQVLTDEEYEELSDGKIAKNEQITFTGFELIYFVLVLKNMFAIGELNIPKAIHWARFCADKVHRIKELDKADQKTEPEHIEEDNDKLVREILQKMQWI